MHDIAVPSIDTTAVLLQSEAGEGGSLGVAVVLLSAVAAAAIIRLGRLWRIGPDARGAEPVELGIWLLGAMLAYVAGAFGAAVPPADDPAYARLASGAVGNLAQVVVAALFLARFTRPLPLPALPASRAARAGIAGFLLITPIVAAVSIAVNGLMNLAGLPRAPEAAHATLALLAERRDPMLAALTLAHVTLLVPVAEEFVWRGMMQPGLRALLGVKAGIAVTALLFTLIHVSAIASDGLPAGLAMLAVLAVGLGILRERTGSVLAPVIVHALFNAFNVAITLMKNPAGGPTG